MNMMSVWDWTGTAGPQPPPTPSASVIPDDRGARRRRGGSRAWRCVRAHFAALVRSFSWA